jgi:hypothetical protein
LLKGADFSLEAAGEPGRSSEAPFTKSMIQIEAEARERFARVGQ